MSFQQRHSFYAPADPLSAQNNVSTDDDCSPPQSLLRKTGSIDTAMRRKQRTAASSRAVAMGKSEEFKRWSSEQKKQSLRKAKSSKSIYDSAPEPLSTPRARNSSQSQHSQCSLASQSESATLNNLLSSSSEDLHHFAKESGHSHSGTDCMSPSPKLLGRVWQQTPPGGAYPGCPQSARSGPSARSAAPDILRHLKAATATVESQVPGHFLEAMNRGAVAITLEFCGFDVESPRFNPLMTQLEQLLVAQGTARGAFSFSGHCLVAFLHSAAQSVAALVADPLSPRKAHSALFDVLLSHHSKRGASSLSTNTLLSYLEMAHELRLQHQEMRALRGKLAVVKNLFDDELVAEKKQQPEQREPAGAHSLPPPPPPPAARHQHHHHHHHHHHRRHPHSEPQHEHRVRRRFPVENVAATAKPTALPTERAMSATPQPADGGDLSAATNSLQGLQIVDLPRPPPKIKTMQSDLTEASNDADDELEGSSTASSVLSLAEQDSGGGLKTIKTMTPTPHRRSSLVLEVAKRKDIRPRRPSRTEIAVQNEVDIRPAVGAEDAGSFTMIRPMNQQQANQTLLRSSRNSLGHDALRETLSVLHKELEDGGRVAEAQRMSDAATTSTDDDFLSDHDVAAMRSKYASMTSGGGDDGTAAGGDQSAAKRESQSERVRHSYGVRANYVSSHRAMGKYAADRTKSWRKWIELLRSHDSDISDVSATEQVQALIDFARMSLGCFANWLRMRTQSGRWRPYFAVVRDFNILLFDRECRPSSLHDAVTVAGGQYLALSLAHIEGVRLSDDDPLQIALQVTGSSEKSHRIAFRCDSADGAKQWAAEMNYQIHIVSDLCSNRALSFEYADHKRSIWVPVAPPYRPKAQGKKKGLSE